MNNHIRNINRNLRHTVNVDGHSRQSPLQATGVEGWFVLDFNDLVIVHWPGVEDGTNDWGNIYYPGVGEQVVQVRLAKQAMINIGHSLCGNRVAFINGADMVGFAYYPLHLKDMEETLGVRAGTINNSLDYVFTPEGELVDNPYRAGRLPLRKYGEE